MLRACAAVRAGSRRKKRPQVNDMQEQTLKLGLILKAGAARLLHGGLESPGLAAEFLLAHALGCTPAELRRRLLLDPAQIVDSTAAQSFDAFIARHAQGEPVAYILGEWEFYGLPFHVSPAVLIPRPETEMLVDAALEILKRRPPASQSDQAPPARLADFGTGSGCLAISVLANFPHSVALAVDISPAALHVAENNAERHSVSSRFAALAADFTQPLANAPLWNEIPERMRPPFDIILANPPYVSAAEYAALEANVRSFEPCGALVPGTSHNGPLAAQDGLEDIRLLAIRCAEALRPNGTLLMEFGAAQGPDTLRIFTEQGDWAECSIEKDLAGRDRMLRAVRKG